MERRTEIKIRYNLSNRIHRSKRQWSSLLDDPRGSRRFFFQDQYTKPTIHFKKALNQYPVLPPISSSSNRNDNFDQRSVASDAGQGGRYYDQEVPTNESMMSLNLNDPNDQQQQQQYQPEPPMMSQPEDTYLPQEPVLLTDFEEQRLANQIREQLGGSAAVERLKLLYQELTTYDPNRTNFVHYSHIQMLTHQLGVSLGRCSAPSIDGRSFFIAPPS